MKKLIPIGLAIAFLLWLRRRKERVAKGVISIQLPPFVIPGSEGVSETQIRTFVNQFVPDIKPVFRPPGIRFVFHEVTLGLGPYASLSFTPPPYIYHLDPKMPSWQVTKTVAKIAWQAKNIEVERVPTGWKVTFPLIEVPIY